MFLYIHIQFRRRLGKRRLYLMNGLFKLLNTDKENNACYIDRNKKAMWKVENPNKHIESHRPVVSHW